MRTRTSTLRLLVWQSKHYLYCFFHKNTNKNLKKQQTFNHINFMSLNLKEPWKDVKLIHKKQKEGDGYESLYKLIGFAS